MHSPARSPSPSAYADLKRGLLAVDFGREREDESRGAGVDGEYERGGGAVVGLERAHVQRIVGLMLAESLHFGTRGVLQRELPGLDLKRLGARVEQLDLDEHELLATGQGTLHARLTLWHRFGHTSEHHLQHRERRWTRTRKSERTGSGGWPSARGTGS